jgi:heme exporter protein D
MTRVYVWIAVALSIIGFGAYVVHSYNAKLAESDLAGYERGKLEVRSAALSAALAETERLRGGEGEGTAQRSARWPSCGINYNRRKRMRRLLKIVCLLGLLMALSGCPSMPTPPSVIVAPQVELPAPPPELMETEEANFLERLMRRFSSPKPPAPIPSPGSSGERSN